MVYDVLGLHLIERQRETEREDRDGGQHAEMGRGLELNPGCCGEDTVLVRGKHALLSGHPECVTVSKFQPCVHDRICTALCNKFLSLILGLLDASFWVGGIQPTSTWKK